MKQTSLARLRLGPRGLREDGMALITVLLVTMVLASLVMVTLDYGVASMALARRSQDWNASLTTADAGVDDFLYRLNAAEDTSYTYAQSVRDQTAAACPRADGAAVGACGWATLPGGVNASKYQYSIPATGVTGKSITVNVKGQVRNVTRNLSVSLGRTSFLDYAYFSDHETQDPADYVPPEYPTQPQNQADAYQYCQNYFWVRDPAAAPLGAGTLSPDPRHDHSFYPPQNGPCVVTEWTTGVTFTGPVRTNDILSVNGDPTFQSPVTVGRPVNATTPGPNNGRNNFWWDDKTAFGGAQSNPNFQQGISAGAPIPLPPDNPNLRNWGTPAQGGCTYYGLTSVEFKGALGVTVYSPNTPAASLGANCTADGTMAVPTSGVIYVKPLSQATACVGDKTLKSIVFQNDYHVVRDGAYDCHAADVFVGGVLSGNLTVGSDDIIAVYKNITYTGGLGAGSTDVLGLEPVNAVEVYNPVQCNKTPPTPCQLQNDATNLLNPKVDTIDAAMLAFNHSFRTENYWFGSSLGTMNVNGTITQRYRGRMAGTPQDRPGPPLVKGSGAGYGKNYKWDPRLATIGPRHFLPPGLVAWGVTRWSEEKGG